MKQRGKHASTTIQRLCSLRGPYRGIILKTTGATQSDQLSSEKRWRYSSVHSSVSGYSPESKDASTEAEVSPLLRAVTKQRLMQTGEDLACNDL
jgi:hypothetical protein